MVKIPDSLCEECQIGNSCRQPRHIATEDSRKSTGPLDLVHVDIVGLTRYPSFAGKKYFIPLYDENSAASLVRFLRSRDDASRAIQEMITDLEIMRKGLVKQLNITACGEDRVNRLRCDNAKEFLSKKFKQWLQERGIQHDLTASYSPESNGKAERLNRNSLDMVRIIFLSSRH